MKTRLYILSLTIIIFIAFACSKNPKCWGENKNKGIINEEIRIDYTQFDKEQYIITNDSMYRKTFPENIDIPTIDFNEYTLLGLYASGQCEIKFIREVTKIESEKRYYYEVKVKSCGWCKKEGYSYNWVTVPKLPDAWTVSFEVIEK